MRISIDIPATTAWAASLRRLSTAAKDAELSLRGIEGLDLPPDAAPFLAEAGLAPRQLDSASTALDSAAKVAGTMVHLFREADAPGGLDLLGLHINVVRAGVGVGKGVISFAAKGATDAKSISEGILGVAASATGIDALSLANNLTGWVDAAKATSKDLSKVADLEKDGGSEALAFAKGTFLARGEGFAKSLLGIGVDADKFGAISHVAGDLLLPVTAGSDLYSNVTSLQAAFKDPSAIHISSAGSSVAHTIGDGLVFGGIATAQPEVIVAGAAVTAGAYAWDGINAIFGGGHSAPKLSPEQEQLQKIYKELAPYSTWKALTADGPLAAPPFSRTVASVSSIAPDPFTKPAPAR